MRNDQSHRDTAVRGRVNQVRQRNVRNVPNSIRDLADYSGGLLASSPPASNLQGDFLGIGHFFVTTFSFTLSAMNVFSPAVAKRMRSFRKAP